MISLLLLARSLIYFPIVRCKAFEVKIVPWILARRWQIDMTVKITWASAGNILRHRNRKSRERERERERGSAPWKHFHSVNSIERDTSWLRGRFLRGASSRRDRPNRSDLFVSTLLGHEIPRNARTSKSLSKSPLRMRHRAFLSRRVKMMGDANTFIDGNAVTRSDRCSYLRLYISTRLATN